MDARLNRGAIERDAMLRNLITRLWHGVVFYALKFGVVGLFGFVIDVGLFNLLRLGMLGDVGWWQTAIGAKVISTSVAIVFNWIGNRFWTFREHRRRNVLLEFFEYGIVSIAGMGIAVGCLWFSHHVLGFQSLVADNISTNVIGLGLGTAFRFVLYRYWVYGHNRPGTVVARPTFVDAQRAVFEEPVPEEARQGRLEGPTAPEPAEGSRGDASSLRRALLSDRPGQGTQ